MEKKFLSTSEVAKILGISRVAVFKKIKLGQIKAHKVGKTYVIEPNQLGISYRSLTEKDKKRIKKAVDRVIDQYGDVIKKLGKE